MTKLERFQQAGDWCKVRLPVLGIVAFSMCSVNAVYNLLVSNATHPIDAFWLAAFLVELVTAWLVSQVVDTFRRVTRSKISKQDRRFYGSLLALFIILATPSLGLSVWANRVEFNGSLSLGLVFPGLSVACAVGAALPGVASKHEQNKAKEQQRLTKVKAENARIKAEKEQILAREKTERARLAAESEQARIIEQQRADKERAEREQVETKRQQNYARLNTNARQILHSLATDGQQTQAALAGDLGVKPQTVAHHIKRLSNLDLITRNGSGVRVLVEVE